MSDDMSDVIEISRVKSVSVDKKVLAETLGKEFLAENSMPTGGFFRLRGRYSSELTVLIRLTYTYTDADGFTVSYGSEISRGELIDEVLRAHNMTREDAYTYELESDYLDLQDNVTVIIKPKKNYGVKKSGFFARLFGI